MMIDAAKFLKENNVELTDAPRVRKDQKDEIEYLNIEKWPLRHNYNSVGLRNDIRAFPKTNKKRVSLAKWVNKFSF